MTMQLFGKKDDGKDFTLSAPVAEKSSVIMIRCDILLPNTGLEVVLAFVNFNRKPSRENPVMMLPPVDPGWVDALVSFDYDGEHFDKYRSKCFRDKNDCENIKN